MLIIFLITFFTFYDSGLGLGYKAAVVEYYPIISEDSPTNTINKNIDQYRQIIDNAKDQAADIIVFPEYGLTNLVKDPEQYAIEIEDNNEFLKKLSALASERNMYAVINLLEKETNNSKTYYYNTNLVFDRNGTIKIKYRKINLFQEAKLTPGDDNQKTTFKTDFGVTFGIFTCFDMLFHNPSRTVLKNPDVTDIVFPTAWISVLPFYHSLSVQHGYSVANGINLLAANFGRPKEARGGSGIYYSDGKIAENYIGDTPSSKLIVQDVTRQTVREDKSYCQTPTAFGLPTDLGKSNVSNYHTEIIFNAADYTFKDVDLTQANFITDVCHRNFCCNFDIKLNPSNVGASEYYKVMAYDGNVKYDDNNLHIRVCSLVFCENESKDSCGKRSENVTTKFTKIKVSGNLNIDNTTFYTPVTLNANLLPMPQTTYCNKKNATETTYVQLSLTKATSDILVFGLLGHTQASLNPDNGDDDNGGNSAEKTSSLVVLLVLSTIIKKVMT